MKAPQDEQPTNGVSGKVKENKQIYRLSIDGKEMELYDAFNDIEYPFGLDFSYLRDRKGNFSETMTLDPFSPTFIDDFYTFIKK